MRLRSGKSGFIEAEKVRVGGFDLWIRKEPRAGQWDLEVTEPILAGDEYELEPLISSGHELRWVLDIGAHIGSFALRIKNHWPQARIIAAEPDPDSAALLRKNVEGLPGVFAHEVAVLGNGGSRRVHLRQAGRANSDRNAAASSVKEVIDSFDEGALSATTTVDAIGIVELISQYDSPVIDLLKLDCEGAEGPILEALAATDLMKSVRWIRGEWHFHATIPRIEAALAKTHTVAFHRGDTAWGFFIAHHNSDG